MAEKSLGTKLKMGNVAVAGLTSIGGLDLSADTIDVTTLDSEDGWREFIGGLKDAGEVPVSGFFNLETGKGQAELYEAFDSGEVKSFTIEFPPKLGAKWEFKGIVTKFATGADLEDPVSFEGAIKVSGKPTLNLTPAP